MSKTPDPEASAKLPPPPDVGGARARSDTFARRKADARDVGLDTAFVDGLTSDLVLDGVPDHLVPGGARDEQAKPSDLSTVDAKSVDEALDADALFDASAEPEPEPGAEPAVHASIEETAGAVDGEASKEESVEIPPPVASTPPPKAASTPKPEAGSEAPLNPATLAIGGAILAIVLLLGFKTCSGSGTDDAADRTAAAARSGAAADGAAANGAAANGAAGDGGAAGGGAAAGAGDGAQEGGAQDGAGAAAAEGANAEPDAAQASGDDAGADAEGEAAADETAGEAAAAEGGSEAGEIAIVDETDDEGQGEGERRSSGGGGGPSAMPASSGETDPDRAAEAQMSAEELLAAAKDSLKRKRYRDAYRQSTSSYHKKATQDALKVRVQSACGMNNQGAAKSSFDKVSGLSERRELRSKCRDHGVRLGL